MSCAVRVQPLHRNVSAVLAGVIDGQHRHNPGAVCALLSRLLDVDLLICQPHGDDSWQVYVLAPMPPWIRFERTQMLMWYPDPDDRPMWLESGEVRCRLGGRIWLDGEYVLGLGTFAGSQWRRWRAGLLSSSPQNPFALPTGGTGADKLLWGDRPLVVLGQDALRVGVRELSADLAADALISLALLAAEGRPRASFSDPARRTLGVLERDGEQIRLVPLARLGDVDVIAS